MKSRSTIWCPTIFIVFLCFSLIGFCYFTWFENYIRSKLRKRAPPVGPRAVAGLDDGIMTFNNATFRCDYKYNKDINGWMKYHKIPSTWHDARLRCDREGAMLASPTSTEMLDAMVEYSRTFLIMNKQIFTGLHSTFSKGQFYTLNGISISELKYYWAKNQPDNIGNDESCLVLNLYGQLSDTGCGETNPYICFKSNDPETFTNECGTTDPGYKLDSRTNKCYKFHTVPRNFSRAHLVCSAEGGHLAIINSDQESEVLKELFATIDPSAMTGNIRKDLAFIGFHDWGEHGEWKTIHDESLEEAGFAKFIQGEPNNVQGIEFCGSIDRTGLLNDLACDQPFAFICEKKPDYPKVCNGTEAVMQFGVEQYSRVKTLWF